MCYGGVFIEKNGQLFATDKGDHAFYHYFDETPHQPYKYNKWACATGNKLSFEDHPSVYPSGYHKLLKKRDSLDYSSYRILAIVRKVFLREIVFKGWQETLLGMEAPCVVAKQMLIPSD
jgi:hypothetical protein